MKQIGIQPVCIHDRCASALCGELISGLAAVGYQYADGSEVVFHVMCAPPQLRKAYHEAERQNG